MKVAIIFLDYQRKDFSDTVKAVNLNNAGYPFSLITIERYGISAAFNEGISKAAGHDAVVFMANDITMPNNWLAYMVHYATTIPNTGLVGIHTVETLPPVQELAGLQVHPCICPFGNTLVPMAVIDKIGGYNEDFDPYGMQDADFGYRAQLAGFVNYYLPQLQAKHIGHDVGQRTEYRLMKDAGLLMAHSKWEKWKKHYEETGDYNHPIIMMQQFPGE